MQIAGDAFAVFHQPEVLLHLAQPFFRLESFPDVAHDLDVAPGAALFARAPPA